MLHCFQATTDFKENEPTKPAKSMFTSTAPSTQAFSVFVDDEPEGSAPTAMSVQTATTTLAQRGAKLPLGLTSLRQPLSSITDTIVITDSPFSQGELICPDVMSKIYVE